MKISNSNTNSQLEIGNTGTGNTSTLATFNNSKTQKPKHLSIMGHETLDAGREICLPPSARREGGSTGPSRRALHNRPVSPRRCPPSRHCGNQRTVGIKSRMAFVATDGETSSHAYFLFLSCRLNTASPNTPARRTTIDAVSRSRIFLS